MATIVFSSAINDLIFTGRILHAALSALGNKMRRTGKLKLGR
ncbi:MAG TPA: hypothetical protein VG994_19810 [Steroidobacteraceae bacterium]|nr:hypothetical protein [Steroidobacteraceae bacterium]